MPTEMEQLERRRTEITVAKLEVVIEELKNDFHEHVKIEHDWQIEHTREQREWQDKIMESLNDIKTQLTKYQGVIGGVTLVATLIWAGLTMFKDQIFGFLKIK